MDSTNQSNNFQQLQLSQKIQQEQQAACYRKQRHYGNLIPIMMDAETGQPKYLLGPHYYLFVPVWLVSGGLLVYVLYQVVHTAYLVLFGLCVLLGVNFLYFYAKIGFSLPGVASSDQEPDFAMRANDRYCMPCRIVRPKGTHHCYYCDVCIFGMDHHCPWVGKCIGRDNLCLFYQFLISITVLMVCLIFTVVFIPSGNIQKL